MNNNTNIYNELTKLSTQDIITKYSIDINGLSENQVQESIRQYGLNTVSYGKKEHILIKLIKEFFTPFTIVLIILAVVSFFTDYMFADVGERDLTAVLIILIMVIMSGLLSFFQSEKSSNAASKLKKMVSITTKVKRSEKNAYETPMEEIVKNDIIYLGAGDMIPADMRILQSKDLFISQSALTGESAPVEKTSSAYEVKTTDNPYDYENMVFMGSNVVSGSAIGIVINVGSKTYFGEIAKNITVAKPQTNFDKGINSVSWLLIRFMLIMVPIVFFINGFFKGDWLNSMLFALSIAVGLTPQMLPMIVTTNLSKGSVSLAKEGTIVKSLNSVQSFGAIDVLCTDKTGTLTQDKIVLEYHQNLLGEDDDYVLKMAYLNSYYQTGLNNLMDEAIIESANKQLNVDKYGYKYTKVDEIPFDFNRRRMSVVIQNYNTDTLLVTKGAIEELLSISTTAYINKKVVTLDEKVKTKVMDVVDKLGSQGFRVIGLATKKNPPAEEEFEVKDESEMTLIGILAFLDPPKESAKNAIKALESNNVKVKVITGDNELVTRNVCNQVGLSASKIYYGKDIEDKNDDELKQITEEYDIFVKVSPDQKTKIVTTIKNNDHVVGYMGDGINDAMAMKAADVGICVDTAVDISKESADVILLDKDLMVLEKGIMSGRKIFGNTMKYIKITASSNFGNMFSVLVATLFLPFLPMLPLQILILNLIYDISCISLPWDNMDSEYLTTPKRWSAKSIKSFMMWFGPTSSIFDILTYLLMYFVICPAILGNTFHNLNNADQAIFITLFHTGWFIMSLWTQTFIIHVLRTEKVPFIKSSASLIVFVVTTLGIVLGTYLAYSPINVDLEMLPLPIYYFAYLIVIIIGYILLTSLVKYFYIKKFKQLL
ncbi:magnesium-translocating P-type ATPase [Mycoplasma sp. P36-A1]|uniref:magnesium-translocating P-type ATPase n=1 Tax=Mycoplasma sp. P36-A1 TaxID=3252900 RepID=UPI003C2D5A06